MDIPKIIHQLWLQGENKIPNKFKEDIIKIKELHQKWKYYIWDENKILNMIKDNKYIKNKYLSFKFLHQKVDFIKIVILYYFGGIFIDIDAEVIKPLDSLFQKYNNYDLIISFIATANNYDIKNILICEKLKDCYNNGIIISKPKADILKYLYLNFDNKCKININKSLCISQTTGPLKFNKLINNYKGTSKILILDNSYLEPCIMDICNINDNTYIKHKHNLSWLHPFFVKIINLYYKYKKYLIFFLILCIYILCN